MMSINLNSEQCALLQKLARSLLNGNEEYLDATYENAVRRITMFDEGEFIDMSLSPFEESQIIEQVEKHVRNLYTNADEVINQFHGTYRSLKDENPSYGYSVDQLLCFLRIGEGNRISENQEYQSQLNEVNSNISLPIDFNSGDTINSLNIGSQMEDSMTLQSNSPIESPSPKNIPCKKRFESSLTRNIVCNSRFESPLLRNVGPTHHLYTDTPPLTEPTAFSSAHASSTKHSEITPHGDSISYSESPETFRPASLSINSKFSEAKKINLINDEITEYEIMKELIFCMQGIEGRAIKYISIDEGFSLNPCIKVDQEPLVRHLMELGYLHNLIKHRMTSLFTNIGIVAEGLLSAVRRELTDYYQALAALDKKLSLPSEVADTPLSEQQCAEYEIPTLSQIFVWSRKPMEKLKTLADVLRLIRNKQGGEIVSILAYLSCNGNLRVKEIVLRLLSSAIQLFYKQIFYWVVNGEIIDTRHEFFIKAESAVDSFEQRNSWDKRFVLRPSMIPSYMSEEEANQILETGRGMNFLHNICQQRPPMTSSQASLLDLEKNKWSDAKSLIQPRNQVSELINKAYREVSKIVLDTLGGKFKMMTHLEALRKYMLLGHGDFIHHLLEAIEPDLNKPVGSLHNYNLMRSLEDAIYKSNAQFDDTAVVKKLWVNTLATSERENLSEAFCLQYKLDGPLYEIFKPSLIAYNRMFTFMWRVKRAHHMILKMWRGLKLLHKEVNKLISETRPVFVQVNCLVMEMLNFLNHFEFYIASEVVEVKWRKFQSEMANMESFESVVQAHLHFVETIQTSCMLNEKRGCEIRMTMAWHIRSLLDYIQELVPIVETFQTLCENELERRKTRQEGIAEFGTSVLGEQQNSVAIIYFQEEMNKVKTKFKVLSNQYQEKLKSLLVLFCKDLDNNDLVLLRHRIDFNEYYKQTDNRLSDSLKVYGSHN